MKHYKFWLPLCVLASVILASASTARQLPNAKTDQDTLQGSWVANQDQKIEPKQIQRLIYAVKHGNAADLATVLNAHFKGKAEFVAVPQSAGSVLLVNFLNLKLAVHDDVMATLAKLDLQAPVVSIEVILLHVDLTPRPQLIDDNKTPPQPRAPVTGVDWDLKQLSGPADKVSEYIDSLQKRGVIAGQRRFQLVTMANNATALSTKQSKAYVSGVVSMGKGANPGPVPGPKGSPIARTIQYRDIGTAISVLPSVGADNLITVNVSVDDSQAIQREDGIPIGQDEKGAPILATEFVKTEFNPTVTMTSGQAILVNALCADSKTGGTRTWLIVSARLQ